MKIEYILESLEPGESALIEVDCLSTPEKAIAEVRAAARKRGVKVRAFSLLGVVSQTMYLFAIVKVMRMK